MKFLNSCIGKIFTAIFCVLLGVVLTLGGIVGAGYFALTTKGMMGTVEEKVNDTGAVTLEFSDDVRAMSVLEWAKGFADVFSKLTEENGPTIGDLERYIGLNLISSALSDFLKLDPEVIAAASLVGDETGIVAVITQEMTMNKVMEMVGENIMPDLPLFDEEGEFMNLPIKEAFSSLTDFTLGDFLTIDENSAQAMKAIAGIKIGEVADVLPTLPIGNFIDMTEETHPIVKAIADLSINDLGTSKLTETINTVKLSDILSDMNEDTTNKILYSMRDLTVGDLTGSEADTLIQSMFLDEIMDIDDSSNQALQSLRYSCISSQFVTLTSPAVIGEYAYAEGPDYQYLTSGPEGGYYVMYYPETSRYTAQTDSYNVLIQRNGKYLISYELYVATDSLANDKVTLNGVEFTAVKDEENNNVVEGAKTLVAAPVYVSAKDVERNENVLKLSNRYTCFYDEEGNFLFVGHFDDEVCKGCILLPAEQVVSVDASSRLVSSRSAYKIVESNKYLDNKALKSDGTIRVSDADVPVYEMHPLQGVNETLNDLTLGGVLEINESSPRLMQSLKDTKITEMGDVIDTMPLGDLVDVGDSRILNSLADTPINGMSEKIDTLFIDELMTISSDSSRMIQALRYASIETKSEYILKTSLIAATDPALTSVANYAEYAAREVDYYKNYKMSDGTTQNRYFYKVDGGAITDVYVLYLTDADEEKTEGGNTLFYNVRNYGETEKVFVDLSVPSVKQSSAVDLAVEGNQAFIDAEKEGSRYYYLVDGSGKITDVYVQSGVVVQDGEGRTEVGHTLHKSRPQVGMSDKTNELVLSDVLEITPSSSKILRNLADIKVNKMGTKIDNMTLGEMVDTGSSKLLQSLSDTTLNDLGDTVNTLFIDEIITIDNDTSQMMKALRYATLESQIVYLDKTSLQSSDTVVADNAAEYKALETATYNAYEKSDSTVVNRYYYRVTDGSITETYVLYYNDKDLEKTSGTNTAFYKIKLYEQKEYSYKDLTTLTASENVDTTAGDNAAIVAAQEEGKVYYYDVDGGTNEITTTYIVMYDGETPIVDPSDSTKTKVYTVTEKYNRPMVGLSDKTNELTLEDVFSEENLTSGVLSLINRKTKLNNISSEVATAVQNSSVAILVETGVIDSATFTGSDFTSLAKERKCFIYNSTMTDMLNGLIGFVSNPLNTDTSTYPPTVTVNYSRVSPTNVPVSSSSFASLSAFVAAYDQYNELTFDANTTVTIDPVADAVWGRDIDNDSNVDYYAIPVFSVDGTNTVAFSGGTVYLAVYNKAGSAYTDYSAHQAAYFYDESNCGIAAETANVKLEKLS